MFGCNKATSFHFEPASVGEEGQVTRKLFLKGERHTNFQEEEKTHTYLHQPVLNFSLNSSNSHHHHQAHSLISPCHDSYYKAINYHSSTAPRPEAHASSSAVHLNNRQTHHPATTTTTKKMEPRNPLTPIQEERTL